MEISLLALVALVVWLIVVLDLRHRVTRRAGRDPWAVVGPRPRSLDRPGPRAVSAVGALPPATSPVDSTAGPAPERPGWARAA